MPRIDFGRGLGVTERGIAAIAILGPLAGQIARRPASSEGIGYRLALTASVAILGALLISLVLAHIAWLALVLLASHQLWPQPIGAWWVTALWLGGWALGHAAIELIALAALGILRFLGWVLTGE